MWDQTVITFTKKAKFLCAWKLFAGRLATI
jgi:hypothetical protein